MSKKEGIQPIEDTPENVAKAIMQGKPKKDWRYKKQKRCAKRKNA